MASVLLIVVSELDNSYKTTYFCFKKARKQQNIGFINQRLVRGVRIG